MQRFHRLYNQTTKCHFLSRTACPSRLQGLHNKEFQSEYEPIIFLELLKRLNLLTYICRFSR